MTHLSSRNSEEAHVPRRTAEQESNGEYQHGTQNPPAGVELARAARLLSDRAVGEYINAPARAAALQTMQRTYGNRSIQRYIRPADMCEEEYRPERPKPAPVPPKSSGAPSATPDRLAAQGWLPQEGTDDGYIHPLSGERMKGPQHTKPKQAQTPATSDSLVAQGWVPMEGTENEYINPMSGERMKGPKHTKPKQVQTPDSLMADGWLPQEGTEDEYVHPLSGERMKGPKHGYTGGTSPDGGGSAELVSTSGPPGPGWEPIPGTKDMWGTMSPTTQIKPGPAHNLPPFENGPTDGDGNPMPSHPSKETPSYGEGIGKVGEYVSSKMASLLDWF